MFLTVFSAYSTLSLLRDLKSTNRCRCVGRATRVTRVVFFLHTPCRFFRSRAEVQAFRQFVTQRLNATFSREMGRTMNLTRACPTPSGVVLVRKEGHGLRLVKNPDVLDRVLTKAGIKYRNVSLNYDTTSMFQISIFSNFGLIISSHRCFSASLPFAVALSDLTSTLSRTCSSQLKNSVFANDNTIILETKPVMFADSFSDGTEHLNIIYKHSIGHAPDLAQARSHPVYASDADRAMIESDYYLDEKIFEADLREALAEQRRRCGDIWRRS
eukprot:m.239797 g.239797  ORF g.239797 m.239797 type:complete len:271 (-) comp54383_c0_seq6:70-882(-)